MLDTSSQQSTAKNRPVTPERAVAIDAVPVFRAEAFPNSGPVPWLDRPDAHEAIDRGLAEGWLDAHTASYARSWTDHGYFIIEKAFDDSMLDRTWAAYERAAASGTTPLNAEPHGENDPHPGRFLNPHFHIREVDEMLRHEKMADLVSTLVGAKAIPFQTITSHKGSQQLPHSDSIHMTSYPLGYLAANWIAFEDIDSESGPLVYYPGSHRLPYTFSQNVGITAQTFAERGFKEYHEKYEPRIAQLIAEAGIEPHYFHAKKGDTLFWHANLVHGGSPRRNLTPSRKALVCHYFFEGCISYHDLTSSWSHLHEPGFITRHYETIAEHNDQLDLAPRKPSEKKSFLRALLGRR